MTDKVRLAFVAQAQSCETLGSPLTAHILRLLADELTSGPVAERVLGWRGGPYAAADAVALRLAAGLHGLVLSQQDTELQAFYHAPEAHSDAKARHILRAAILRHPLPLLQWLDSPPQTNEVRRSAALIAAGHWLTARFGLPLVLSELGASAGLNLIWDQYCLNLATQSYGLVDSEITLTPVWRGAMPQHCPPQVAARAGVDLAPINPKTEIVRLLSYIWPDQSDRLTRTQNAAALAATTLTTPVERADAIDWLGRRLAVPHPRRLHVIFHTIAWQYFTPEAQNRGAALLAAAGACASRDAPLAHLSIEADGQPNGAAMTLRLWPGDHRIHLGRMDFHGRWVEWQGG